TLEGLKAVKVFTELDITTNVTLIFNPNQALLAARAGATYVSPFIGRLDDIGQDGMDLVYSIAQIFEQHKINSNIIPTAIINPIHATDTSINGAQIPTIPHEVLGQLIKHPLTDQGIEQFATDWENAKK